MSDFPPEYAHINFMIEDDYIFSFGYPVLIPEALETLRDKLARTVETGDPATTLLPPIISFATNYTTLSENLRAQLTMMLCGTLLWICERKNYEVKAGNMYQVNIRHEDDSTVIDIEKN